MTGSFPHFEELQHVLDALCEETITPAQTRRLEELVLGYPEAEAYYVQLIGLHADISRHFDPAPSRATETLGERIDGRQPAPASRSPRRRRRIVWGAFGLAGLAAALIVALTLPWGSPTGGPPPEGDPDDERVDNSVAVLLHTHGAEWEENDLRTKPGSPLPPGWLHLKSGFAHIEFYSGATVILQGPADFQLISRSEAFCARGKLRATVPATAHGFTIGSPKFDVIDRGTEFGLNVEGPDKAEVHVFEGEVDIYNAGTGRAAASRRTPPPGKGVRVGGPDGPSNIDSDSTAFKTTKDLAQEAAKEIARRRTAWKAASAELRKDESLLVYFTFESGESWSRTLLDQARGRRQPHDGTIVGCAWVAGRWLGKRGLEFKQVSDRVRFNVPGEFAALTLAAWVRMDALPNRFNALMLTDGWDEGAPHWQILNDGRLELGVQGSDGEPGVHYFSAPVFNPDRLGEWTHIAVVYDGAAKRVTHYLDGRPIKREGFKSASVLSLGNVELGNWNAGPRRTKDTVRYLTGAIDEFLFFSRPLHDREVEQLYEQGRPPQ